MLFKDQNVTNRRKPQKTREGILTDRIIFTNIGSLVFIMLKKKSLTTHLLLTIPTAVFRSDDRVHNFDTNV